ncbi:MAG: hypothetical protein ACI9LG_003464 [Moritella dasanensis]|jgi:hypothetical protein
MTVNYIGEGKLVECLPPHPIDLPSLDAIFLP